MLLRFFTLLFFVIFFATQQPVFAQFFWGNDPVVEEQNRRAAREQQRARDLQERRRAPREVSNAPPPPVVYAPAPGVPQVAYREAPQSGAVGFFKRLFGVQEEAPQVIYAPQQAAPVFVDPDAPKQVSGSRTVCVRLCDGAYAPINSGRRSSSERDKELCEAQCPGAEVKVFHLASDDIETGRSQDGLTYLGLPNANKYKTSFVPNCACRPQGKTWADFSQGRDDPTMRSNDTVLTQDQARVMALPLKERQLLEAQLRRERTQKPALQEPAADLRLTDAPQSNNAVRMIQASVSPKATLVEQPARSNLLEILRDPNRNSKPQ